MRDDDHQAAIVRFAELRRLKPSRRPFDLLDLHTGTHSVKFRLSNGFWGYDGRFLDHCDYFTFMRRPTAIVTHSYVKWEELAKWAGAHALVAEKLDRRWWDPQAVSVVLTSKGLRQ